MAMRNYETEQPWIIYTYPYTDAVCAKKGLQAFVSMQCAVCGEQIHWAPKIGEELPEYIDGRAPVRIDFCQLHIHPEKGHPMSWSMPLLNPAVHEEGIDLTLLTMRLEADIIRDTNEEIQP